MRSSLLLALLLVLGGCPSAGDDDDGTPDDDDVADDDDTGDDDDVADDDDSASDDDDSTPDDDDSASDDDDAVDDDDTGPDDDDAADDDDATFCPDDASEPNDLPAQATELLPGGPTLAPVLAAGSVDWFAVPSCPGADVELSWSSIGAASLTLFDADLAVVEARPGVGGSQVFTIQAGSSPSYLLSVSDPDSGCLPYTVSATVDDAACEAACLPDAHEEDDYWGAVPDLTTSTGSWAGLSAVAGDGDLFPLGACAGAEIAWTATFDANQGDLGFQLLDGFGFDILGNTVPTRDVAESFVAPDDGLYWLRVDAPSGCVGYDLGVTVDDSACALSCFPDGLGDLSGPELAAPLDDGGAIQALSVQAGDDRWFAVDLCAGATLSADATVEAAGGGTLGLDVVDDTGAPLAAGVPTSGGVTATYTASSEGTVYVRAQAASGSCTYFALSAAVDRSACPATCEPDLFEDNDTLFGATPIGSFEQLWGLTVAPGDDDWWWIPVCDGGVLSVDVVQDAALDPVTLALVDANSAVQAVPTATADGWSVSATVSPGAPLFAHVAVDGSFCSSYSVTFAVDESACCLPDAAEPNDSLAAAAPLASGALTGLKGSPSDEDWYAVDLCAGGTLDVTATMDWPDANVDLHLVDAAGVPLDASVDFGATEAVSWIAATAQTLYLQVTAAWGDCGDYDLDVQIGGCGGDDDDSALDDDDSAVDDDDSAPDDDDSALDDDDSAAPAALRVAIPRERDPGAL